MPKPLKPPGKPDKPGNVVLVSAAIGEKVPGPMSMFIFRGPADPPVVGGPSAADIAEIVPTPADAMTATAASQGATVVAPYVLLAEGEVNWLYANLPLCYLWTHPGGDWVDALNVDQGPSNFATAAVPDLTAPRTLSWDVTTLAARLLENNTGIILMTLGGTPPTFATKEVGQGATLTLTTTAGTFHPTLVCDTWVDVSTAAPFGAMGTMRPPCLLKFDLTGVTGTVTAATLTAIVINVFTAPIIVAANYLKMPRLITDPAKQIGGVQGGLTATLAQDSDLSGLPQVLQWSDEVSQPQIIADWDDVVPLGGVVWNPVFLTWTEFNIPALQMESRLDNSRIMAWHRWTQPQLGRPYQRAFVTGQHLGYDELYFRYMLEISTDVRLGMTEAGVKLPGMSGTYEWGNTPNLKASNPADVWSCRTEHGPISPAHPDVYRFFAAYAYLYESGGLTVDAGTFLISDFCVRAGQKYSIEQHIRLNTIVSGVPQADGILELWIDGVLAYQRLNVRFRGIMDAQIQDAPFANIFHGGSLFPSAPIHYTVGSFCTATAYIGPAIPAYPAWRTGAPPVDLPLEIAGSSYNDLAGQAYLLDDWGGAGISPATGRAAGFNLGGHDRWETGVSIIDLTADAPVWSSLKASVIFADAQMDVSHYPNGTPTSGHAYYTAQLIEQTQRVMRFGDRAIYGNGGSGLSVDGFNLATNTYDPAGTWADVPAFATGGATVAMIVQDPRSGKVYVCASGSQIGIWEPTGTWTTYGAPLLPYCPGAIDASRERLVARNFVANQLVYMDLLNPGSFSTVTITGPTIVPQDYSALTWDSDNDRYLYMTHTPTGTGMPSSAVTLFAISPTTFAATQIWTSSVAKYQVINGLCNRFLHIPRLGGCVFFAQGSSNTFFFPTR